MHRLVLWISVVALAGSCLPCDLFVPCAEANRMGIDATSINETDEIISVAVPQDADWSFVLEEDGSILEVALPDGIGPAPPRGDGCCRVRLPASQVSPRREAQIFVDDRLYLEVSTPLPTRTPTEGMHAEIAESEDPQTCRTDGKSSARYKVEFSFNPGLFRNDEVAIGTLDGDPVEGMVLDDAMSTDATPQAIVYSTL